jgi:predicted secreted protein
MSESIGTDPGTGEIGSGTTLQGSSTGAIGMVNKISIEGQETDEIDVTTMNTPLRWRAFVAGLKDAKGINVDLTFEATNTGILIAAVNAAIVETFTVTFPKGSTFSNLGFIKKHGIMIPFDTKITASLLIRLSGPPTWHNGSGE